MIWYAPPPVQASRAASVPPKPSGFGRPGHPMRPRRSDLGPTVTRSQRCLRRSPRLPSQRPLLIPNSSGCGRCDEPGQQREGDFVMASHVTSHEPSVGQVHGSAASPRSWSARSRSPRSRCSAAAWSARPRRQQGVRRPRARSSSGSSRATASSPRRSGLSADGGVLEILVSPEGGWTILVTYPSGRPAWSRSARPGRCCSSSASRPDRPATTPAGAAGSLPTPAAAGAAFGGERCDHRPDRRRGRLDHGPPARPLPSAGWWSTASA